MTIKEHPILFQGPMVQAILRPGKTQTRRLITPQNVRFFDGQGRSWKPSMGQLAQALTDAHSFGNLEGDIWTWKSKAFDYQRAEYTNWMAHCKWKVGDRLWVRETWAVDKAWDHLSPNQLPEKAYEAITYFGTDESFVNPALDYTIGKVRQSIFMTRPASRILLEITDVRAERLLNISEEDAIAEGIERLKSGRGYYDPTLSKGAVHAGHYFETASEAYIALWDSINGAGSSSLHPWVWAISFKVLKPELN